MKRKRPKYWWACFATLLAASVSCEKATPLVHNEDRKPENVNESSGESSGEYLGESSGDSAGKFPSEIDPQANSETTPGTGSESKAEPGASQVEDRPTYESPGEEKKPEVQTIEIPAAWRRLSQEHEIWIDKDAKEVIIAGEVCLNQGPLEMFICPQGTKEHESVISANALSSEVHGALIFLGADPGKSCSWDPEYRPAYGPEIEITLTWRDEPSKKIVSKSARDWIRNVKTQKPMAYQWVFGGSEFWEDPDTHEKIYYGDSGEMICLSNFSTATIDLNVESSDSNSGLLFEAFTENIPPLGTKVYATIKPGKRIEPVDKKSAVPGGDGTPKPSETKGADESGKDSPTDPEADKAELN